MPLWTIHHTPGIFSDEENTSAGASLVIEPGIER
jgi:hypothetical protein